MMSRWKTKRHLTSLILPAAQISPILRLLQLRSEDVQLQRQKKIKYDRQVEASQCYLEPVTLPHPPLPILRVQP